MKELLDVVIGKSVQSIGETVSLCSKEVERGALESRSLGRILANEVNMLEVIQSLLGAAKYLGYRGEVEQVFAMKKTAQLRRLVAEWKLYSVEMVLATVQPVPDAFATTAVETVESRGAIEALLGSEMKMDQILCFQHLTPSNRVGTFIYYDCL